MKKLCWYKDALKLAGIQGRGISKIFPVEYYETVYCRKPKMVAN
jgi:hypothetical protein